MHHRVFWFFKRTLEDKDIFVTVFCLNKIIFLFILPSSKHINVVPESHISVLMVSIRTFFFFNLLPLYNYPLEIYNLEKKRLH